jgi:hypothetical protein
MEKLSRVEILEARLLVLDIHSCDVDLACCGSGMGGGIS